MAPRAPRAWPGCGGLRAVSLVALCAPGVLHATPIPPEVTTTPAVDSGTALPFMLAVGGDGTLAASPLTRDYGRDATPFLLATRLAHLDPDELDLHGRFPFWDVPEDSTTKQVVSQESPGQAQQLPDEEKQALEPPQPGVSVGIPSPVAVAGTLLTGLALLVKFLVEFF